MASDYACPVCGPLSDSEYPGHSSDDCVKTLRTRLATLEAERDEARQLVAAEVLESQNGEP